MTMHPINLRWFIEIAALLGAVAMLVSCGSDLPGEAEKAYAALPEVVDYNFHVKPILSDRCYACHGPDENTRKAGLRLDLEKEAFAKLESGKRAFIKGKPHRSEAIHRMTSDDPEYMMPPPDSRLSIEPREIAILAKWLEQGAEWKPHWSLLPVERPEVPENSDEWTTVNPIDNFIQYKLHEQGMQPSPVADRERLIRRVTMDLTGLPPTIREIDEFLADDSPGAYEKVVDRLLRSRAHAERMTMDWLDVARYSDSHGVSFDGARTSWPYRDWVIGTFEDNKPYDEFVTEQLAGDLLPDATKEDIIATAFCRMGQLEVSAGSIPEEFRVEYVAERTAMTGTAFLGLTMECARCHDHKFDPISQKEFYQLSAFFNTTPELGLSPTDDDRAPTLLLFEEEDVAVLDSLNTAIAQQRKVVEAATAAVESGAMPDLPDAAGIAGQVGAYPLDHIEKINRKKKKYKKDAKDEYEDVHILDDNKLCEGTLGVSLVDGKYGKAVLFDGEYDYLSLKETGNFDLDEPYSVSTWINTQKHEKGPTQTIIGNSNHYQADYRGWDLYLDSTNHLRARLIHRLPDDYIEIAATQPIEDNAWVQVGFTYDGLGDARGLQLFANGRRTDTRILHNNLTRSMHPIDENSGQIDTLPVGVGRSYRLWTFDVGLFKGSIDEVRLFDRELSQVEMAVLGEADVKALPRESWHNHAVLHDETVRREQHKLHALLEMKRTVFDSTTEIMVMQEMENPRKTYLLERGLYNKHGEEVQPGAPSHVLPYSEELPRNRLGLAQWLTDPGNPLTSRVAVNRYWQMIFGRGIVKTTEDFGSQGDRPTHPELLDWLASEFIDSGWDLRYMLKLMVMSATYRQSSRVTPEEYEKDPENIYYARSSSYRWPAEIIRDNVLAASGLLVDSVGGPPVRPYQPDGLWEELGGGSKALATYEQDTLDDLYRRSVYTFQRRFMPPPYMSTFDASDREICRTRRNQTSSPLQALLLLNDPQVVEASRILSERVTHEEDTLDDQIMLGYRLSTGVVPTENQVRTLKELYQSALGSFRENPSMADSLLAIGEKPRDQELDKMHIATMTIVASSMFNSDES